MTTYTTTGVPETVRERRLLLSRGGFSEVARWAAHYSLVLIFFWFGLLKFTSFEASGIAPLVMNSPVLMPLQASLGVSSSAVTIGCIEVLAGLLLALRPILPRIAALGAAMAAITFAITVSFLLTTPGVIQPGESPPFALSPMPGQFLLKDVVLFCVSLWILGACLDEARARR